MKKGVLYGCKNVRRDQSRCTYSMYKDVFLAGATTRASESKRSVLYDSF